MVSKYEKEVVIPKTREEEFGESTFEWVKTERSGDVSRFKEFKVENGIEYVVFQDDTRIKTELIGDIVLKHKYENEVLGNAGVFEKVGQDVAEKALVPKFVSPGPLYEPAVVNSSLSPVLTILEKSKKKKKKFQIEITAELPSSEVLNIVRDNFEASDDELFSYLVNKIDKKRFIAAVIASVNK